MLRRETIKAVIEECANESFGRKRGKKSENLISKESWYLIDQRKDGKVKMTQTNNDIAKSNYKNLDKLVKAQTKKTNKFG